MVRAIRDHGGEAGFIRADLARHGEAERLVREAVDLWGRLDTGECTQSNFNLDQFPAAALEHTTAELVILDHTAVISAVSLWPFFCLICSMAEQDQKGESMAWHTRSDSEQGEEWRIVRDALRDRRSRSEERCIHPNLTACGPDEVSCGAHGRRVIRRAPRRDRALSR